MYSRVPLIIALLLAAVASFGQNSVEYGKLPIVPPKTSNPAGKLASRVAGQDSGSKTVDVTDVPSTRSNPTAPDKNAGAQQPAGATSKPAAIFILSSGERLESDDYVLTHDSIQLVQNGMQRTIRMSAVDLQSTIAANKQRGLDLKIPADKSQMVLSF